MKSAARHNADRAGRARRACGRAAAIAAALSVSACHASDEAQARSENMPRQIRFESLSDADQSRLLGEAQTLVRAQIEAEFRAKCDARMAAAGMEKSARAGCFGETAGDDAADAAQTDPAVRNAESARADAPADPAGERDGFVAGERDADGLRVMQLLLAADVVRRLPVDARDTFAIEDGSVFCYAEISSSKEDERMVTLRFAHSTGLTQSYALPVNQSPAWRTWSKLNLTRSMTGAWTCQIFNEDGVLLGSRAFEVTAGD